jgi:hypothetical protein
MILNLMEELDIKGHLTISKVYKTGAEEIVFDDHNIIVSGMGVALAHLFSLSGSNSVVDYQIDRFQIGVGGSVGREVISTQTLGDAMTTIPVYGTDSNIVAVSAHQVLNNAVVTTPRIYGIIPQQNITRLDANTVRYTIILDELALNNVIRTSVPASLNEIGLFVKNIKGQATDAPILVAYRYFNPILKTDDFSLVFRWSISF